jgi:hypothetical protein
MGLRNGISLGIRKKHIRFGNKFDCVEGVRDKLHELETKVHTNEYINERQTLANTHGLPTRELTVCNTNADEPLRFV